MRGRVCAAAGRGSTDGAVKANRTSFRVAAAAAVVAAATEDELAEEEVGGGGGMFGERLTDS